MATSHARSPPYLPYLKAEEMVVAAAPMRVWRGEGSLAGGELANHFRAARWSTAGDAGTTNHIIGACEFGGEW